MFKNLRYNLLIHLFTFVKEKIRNLEILVIVSFAVESDVLHNASNISMSYVCDNILI
jgi:hypothetical protein